MKEIEAKIIEIDPKEIIAKLNQLGAEWEFTLPFHAAYFDLAGMPMKEKGEVLRLRKEGDRVVLTYKHVLPDAPEGIKVREEKEVAVDSYEGMWAILTGLGYAPTLVMNKVRQQYRLGACHVVLDQYEGDFGHIPAFIEIEAPDSNLLFEAAGMLGFNAADLKNWSAAELIAHYRQ